MVSRSCINLVDLASSDMFSIPQNLRVLPRVMTVPGIISDIDDDNASSPMSRKKKIIVANFLPLHAEKNLKSGRWSFSFDEDSPFFQIKDGFSSDFDVFHVGSLKADVDPIEQEEVAQILLEEFNCVPTFLSSDTQKKFYHGFCKQYLWPLFHYMLPICPDLGNRYNDLQWRAYISANKKFADKVVELLNAEDDYVWVHDYHLMLVPIFLRRRFNRIKLGFFLHSPFPSSEIYRTLPTRKFILKALLNADLIGFHTYDYASHFLSCCGRMLGLHYESQQGHIGLEYLGRTIYIKILHVGIHIGRLESALNHPSSSIKVKEIQEQFKGKKIILGVDDMDIFKGINLKLEAMEQLLQMHPEFWGKLVLIQIVNPARTTGKDVEEAKRGMYMMTERINEKYGFLDYKPVILIDRPVPLHEKTAYYALAECCIVNAVRDGMNLMPYKYTVCRQGTPKSDEALEMASGCPRTSTLVVSEFIGCSPSLSGAIRINPWDIDAVADALHLAISMPEAEKQLRHEKHYQYIKSHDVAYWAQSFMQDLEQACKDHYSKRCWGMGFGLDCRILFLSPYFRKLSREHICSVYKRTSRRAIFLDYDGTVVHRSSIANPPSAKFIYHLNCICNDSKNTVFIVSGRGQDSLCKMFSECQNLGIAAEHGYFMRWTRDSKWQISHRAADFAWKNIAEPVMQLYTETTDGSYIETKKTALVWHHQDAASDFGSCQAKELLDHLESVLANEPVVVMRGHDIVEVKPQGVTKGFAAEKVLSSMISNGKVPDFVLCIGDDRSDEDMFESILSYCLSLDAPPEIFDCTVGQKPSKARYYLDDITDVHAIIESLGDESVFKLWR
ncbi:probable alpha,alpha-trehalose-phosphate synthase [UDP-forming] 9 [Pistacia vera]|uniref:probable alpha,alpha-trehalose-phosphate synthase [UDP-forming] 9 n=1 Tax=Pistacia vera TaxID=55513 RepID=UPI0012631491|nr:probable alpha,alpha-trehalose-phosphate synthase [UDP-forming] 9 [Pistacia vera]XP_031277838.1 probable alpha,alpha-trehalose-phosphate synthase [UDP-forming] 9 [Pistacia vera]